MKKLLLLLTMGMTSISANSSEDIYKEKPTISHPNQMTMDEAKKFQMRSKQMQKEMKCGAAKCGNSMNSSKCGAVKIPTH